MSVRNTSHLHFAFANKHIAFDIVYTKNHNHRKQQHIQISFPTNKPPRVLHHTIFSCLIFYKNIASVFF